MRRAMTKRLILFVERDARGKHVAEHELDGSGMDLATAQATVVAWCRSAGLGPRCEIVIDHDRQWSDQYVGYVVRGEP